MFRVTWRSGCADARASNLLRTVAPPARRRRSCTKVRSRSLPGHWYSRPMARTGTLASHGRALMSVRGGGRLGHCRPRRATIAEPSPQFRHGRRRGAPPSRRLSERLRTAPGRPGRTGIAASSSSRWLSQARCAATWSERRAPVGASRRWTPMPAVRYRPREKLHWVVAVGLDVDLPRVGPIRIYRLHADDAALPHSDRAADPVFLPLRVRVEDLLAEPPASVRHATRHHRLRTLEAIAAGHPNDCINDLLRGNFAKPST